MWVSLDTLVISSHLCVCGSLSAYVCGASALRTPLRFGGSVDVSVIGSQDASDFGAGLDTGVLRALDTSVLS